jgi:hypothetical protein
MPMEFHLASKKALNRETFNRGRMMVFRPLIMWVFIGVNEILNWSVNQNILGRWEGHRFLFLLPPYKNKSLFKEPIKLHINGH